MTARSMGQTARSISEKNWWRRGKGSENELLLEAIVKRRRSEESMSTSMLEVHFHWPKAHQTARKSRQRRDRLREQVVQGAGRCAVRFALRTGEEEPRRRSKGASSAEWWQGKARAANAPNTPQPLHLQHLIDDRPLYVDIEDIKLAPWDLDFAADLQEDSSAQEELEVFPPEDLAHGNIHEEHSVRFCDTNETIDHISEHGDFQFRSPEDSTPRDFELSFEQNITEPLIAAESVKSQDPFAFSVKNSGTLRVNMPRKISKYPL
ncbi:hypothetical protein DFH08DRAFT_816469 [Mycena albidolilacea]|uniref:Uncharacterized protein n=1 Tax=Mycena albidolilacea TaxID=1033008 RepID=A0AAD6ZKS6_9AGAR|nr:hypothetical protein DFH08DRAFT_816469 [Mycena albidolilacea]